MILIECLTWGMRKWLSLEFNLPSARRKGIGNRTSAPSAIYFITAILRFKLLEPWYRIAGLATKKGLLLDANAVIDDFRKAPSIRFSTCYQLSI